ncbi:hypothetical protein Bca4012_065911 [Brassica carinata]
MGFGYLRRISLHIAQGMAEEAPLPSSVATSRSANSRGLMGDSITQQDYASSPLDNAAPSGKGSGYNSLEIASIAQASAIVSVLIALVILFLFARKLHPRSKITATTTK